jgi:hypothetical protein
VSPEPVDARALDNAIARISSGIPNVRLDLQPYVETRPSTSPVLHFRLRYEGYKPVTLQLIRVAIPNEARDPNWHAMDVPGHLRASRQTVEGTDCYVKELTANLTPPDPRSGGHDFRVLHPVIVPGTFRDLHELRFVLNPNVTVFRDDLIVQYSIETTEFAIPAQQITLSAVRNT